jgi:hypothetical protein
VPVAIVSSRFVSGALPGTIAPETQINRSDIIGWSPAAMKEMLDVLLGMISILDKRITELDGEIAPGRAQLKTCRAPNLPGTEPAIATALAALTRPPEMLYRSMRAIL